jgi:hypothetical protein
MEAAARARMTPEQAQKVKDIEARLDDPQASEDLAKLISSGVINQQDRSGKSILDQIHARLGQPLYAGDPPDPAPEGMREQALAELLHGIAHTEDICQGDNTTTCTTCVLQTLMARSDPANYARFALGLMFDGAGETPTGKRVQLGLGEVARRDDGSLVDPMIQGSLVAYGLSIGEGSQTGQAGGGRKGLGSVAGGGRGGTGGVGGGGRGGTDGVGGGGRGGTDGVGGGGRGGTGGVGGGGRGGPGGVGGNRLWPLAETLRNQDDRMLSGEQLKGLIKSVMGEDVKAITMGFEDENGAPLPASDQQVDKIRRALAGMPDNAGRNKPGTYVDPDWTTVFTNGVPVAIAVPRPDGSEGLHAIMVVGIEGNRVTFVDPQVKTGGLDGNPRLQTMTLEDFKRRAEWAILPTPAKLIPTRFQGGGYEP